ncbi:uncharacterized protein clcf1 [Paramormyrops kingsleyae]|uniref:Cardiotrophin-like cytokine factor 1 n=1 Tax=Paramormyrops kingsleyae TaxID=1676925 RepID=A0A3B3S0P0_9TELE|nr:cardiotrophin-like cytokine factor 1 [Paramormyrops kingsleyae]
MRHGEVHHFQLAVLLAAVVVSVQVPDPVLSLASERSSIERTYELTKYLEHQLREIKDTYLSYLGPPFSDPDFSPPRPNTTALSLPSAATRLDLWRGLENRARLAQNHKAYSVLLGAVKELARATLCPYLQSSLLHFSVGLDGLLGSISGLMATLGYPLPPHYYSSQTGGASDTNPDPLTPGYFNSQVESISIPDPLPAGPRYLQTVSGGTDTSTQEGWEGQTGDFIPEPHLEMDSFNGDQNNDGGPEDSEEDKVERMTGAKGEAYGSEERSEELMGEEEVAEGWGGRRRLLSVPEGEELEGLRSAHGKSASGDKWPQEYLPQPPLHTEPGQRIRTRTRVMSPRLEVPHGQHARAGQALREVPQGFSKNSNNHLIDFPLQYMSKPVVGDSRRPEYFSSSPAPRHRSPRSVLSSLYTSTLHPPLSPFSLLYQLGAQEGHTLLADLAHGSPLPVLASLSAPPLLAAPMLNDFSRKVESFWVLRELQSWLWRSAKDFNHLKKRLRA